MIKRTTMTKRDDDAEYGCIPCGLFRLTFEQIEQHDLEPDHQENARAFLYVARRNMGWTIPEDK